MNFNSQITTTREQSERLLALGVSSDTADMSIPIKDNPNLNCSARPYKDWNGYWKHNKFVIPAWSLSRLLEIMPTISKTRTDEGVFGLYHETDGAWNLSYPGIEYFETESPFESCILAIEWLINNGYFNKDYLKGEMK